MLTIVRQCAIEDTADLPTEPQLQAWVNHVIRHLDLDLTGELTIRIVSPEESATLNETYRQKTGPTNVLSFPYDTPDNTFGGDLAICAEKVKQEALDQDKSQAAHWAHLTMHGFLHLLGYDHETDAEAHKMEALEINLLQGFGVSNPY